LVANKSIAVTVDNVLATGHPIVIFIY